MKQTLVLIAALALAGCGASETAAGNTAGADRSAGDAAAKRLLGATDQARKIAFVRAVIDTGARCDGVLTTQKLADQDGFPVWRADCKGGTSHIITVTRDGQFSVSSRSD